MAVLVYLGYLLELPYTLSKLVDRCIPELSPSLHLANFIFQNMFELFTDGGSKLVEIVKAAV